MGVLENMAAGRAQYGFGGDIRQKLGDMMGFSEEAQQRKANDALFAQSGADGGDGDGIPVRTSDLVKIFRAKGSSDQDRQLAAQLLEKRLATKNPKAFQAITAGNKLYRFDPNTGQTELAQDFGSEPPSELEQLKLEEQRLRVDQMRRGPQQEQDEFARRAEAARQYGFDPNSPEGKSYILTGKLPNYNGQDAPLTATDRNAILEADEMVANNGAAISSLQKALDLNSKANAGTTAGARTWLGNNLPDYLVPDAVASPDSSLAASELDSTVMNNALSQLKSIFGSAPTEGERKILMDLQGSINQPADVRKVIYDNALAAAKRRLEFNQNRAGQLRSRTYYSPQGQNQPGMAGPNGYGGPQQPGQGQQLADPLGIR